MLPIYSKKSDQLGPLSGNISLLPLTSAPVPGTTGSRKRFSSSAISTIVTGTCVPSHCTLSCMQYATAPRTAPMMTIGCSLMRRLLKKFFRFSEVFHLSSYAYPITNPDRMKKKSTARYP